jgi:HEAT repeat protein
MTKMGIFGKFKRKSRMQKLIDNLYADNMEDRERAILEFASMGESAIEPLIDNITTIKNIPIQGESPDALATVGKPAIEPLVGILKDNQSTEMAYFGAIMAVTEMTDGASGLLIGALRDKAVEPLIVALSRSNCEGLVFANICTALGRIGNPKTIEQMKRALEASKDGALIKDNVKETIEKIQKR